MPGKCWQPDDPGICQGTVYEDANMRHCLPFGFPMLPAIPPIGPSRIFKTRWILGSVARLVLGPDALVEDFGAILLRAPASATSNYFTTHKPQASPSCASAAGQWHSSPGEIGWKLMLVGLFFD